MFDFYVYVEKYSFYGLKTDVEAWQTLVHVCRRWRSLVFESPHRLNLQLYCTPKTHSSDILEVWPALPLFIKGYMSLSSDADDTIVALGHSNRVCHIDLWGYYRYIYRELQKVLAAMQVPFPELTVLRLSSEGLGTPPVIPDTFLGGSAPRLRVFRLEGIAFPGLPKLLLSATHLVELHLSCIPHSGYISPEAMIALLSMLSSLERLSLRSLEIRPQSRSALESRRLPPLKRSVIPSLTYFFYIGVNEYLEELVTSIDAPQLDSLRIIFNFNQIDFDTPRLAQFINHTPKFRACNEVHVRFKDSVFDVRLTNRTHESGFVTCRIEMWCREQDWQLSSIAQVCNSSLLPHSVVEDLYIERQRYSRLPWENDAIENTLWLELLLPFTAVKNLCLAEEFAPGIAAALQELMGGRITEILPSLQNIFVRRLEPWGPFHEQVGQFIAARRLSGHPVAISVWKDEEEIVPPPFVPPTVDTVKN